MMLDNYRWTEVVFNLLLVVSWIIFKKNEKTKMDRLQWMCWGFWEQEKEEHIKFWSRSRNFKWQWLWGFGTDVFSWVLFRLYIFTTSSFCSFYSSIFHIYINHRPIVNLANYQICSIAFLYLRKEGLQSWGIVLGCPRDPIFPVVFSDFFFKLSTQEKRTIGVETPQKGSKVCLNFKIIFIFLLRKSVANTVLFPKLPFSNVVLK